ncbi:transcriptional regulator [Kitasatospora sp. NPDC058162]|uniref:transcriptional regulator n=1 Tax=Kitasatospora sp. NPDC058162 TaxID=3346362 RepID=UPI0036DC3DE6
MWEGNAVAGRWTDFSRYGAQGIPGWLAVCRGLDELVTGIASPVTTTRGLNARLNYLHRTKTGIDALRRAGVTVSEATIRRWFAKKQRPSAANRKLVDAAYWALRRHNVAADLKRRLNAGGAGTRIEIYPVDQSQVEGPRRRELQHRSINVRGIWNDLVDAWDKGPADLAAVRMLDVIWDEVITGLGSDYDAYSYVEHVGFAA